MTTAAYEKLKGISFSDGSPLALAWDGSTLLFDYLTWEEKVLRFRFTNVAYLSGYGGGGTLCEADVSCDAPEIDEAKRTLSRDWGTSDAWKPRELTRLVISDDVPLLTVVFENVDVEALKDKSAHIRAKFVEFGESTEERGPPPTQ